MVAVNPATRDASAPNSGVRIGRIVAVIAWWARSTRRAEARSSRSEPVALAGSASRARHRSIRSPSASTCCRAATRATRPTCSGSTSRTVAIATPAPIAVSSSRSTSSALENSSSSTYSCDTMTVIPMVMNA